MSAQVHQFIAAKTNPLAAAVKRGISSEKRQDAIADRIAARLETISYDPAYLSYAWNMPEALRNRMELLLLRLIHGDKELKAGFRMALAERAEREAIEQIEQEMDEIEAEELFWAEMGAARG